LVSDFGFGLVSDFEGGFWFLIWFLIFENGFYNGVGF